MATSDSWAQDVILCDLCDKPTQQFCNSCQVSLCDTCVKKHREQFKSLIHEIVPFLDRKIQLVCPECQHHPGQRCEANCLQCSEPVCFKCVISGPHKGHEVEELTKIHENIKQKIEKDTVEIKAKIIPEYQRKNAEIEKSMSKTKSQFDEIKTESEKLRKLWHQEVDSIFNKIDSMSQSHREENLNVLQEYHIKLKKVISEINETVKQNEKLFKTNKISAVNKYKSKLQVYRDCPENVDSQMPTLGSKIDNGKELSIEIGDFSAILKQFPQTSLRVDISCMTKTIGELKDQARLIATIPTDCQNVLDVACVGDAEAWIRGNDRNITRIDIHGAVKDTVFSAGVFGPFLPEGIALTREGELIFSKSNTVKIFRQRMYETLITSTQDWSLRRLHCTRSGDILIHTRNVDMNYKYENKIIRYQGQRIKQEIYDDGQGNPIFTDGSTSLFMSENNNGDICVSESNARTVIVVEKTGRVKFRYDGRPARRKESFAPRGIITDTWSQIVVADYNNNCLHILDQDGQFLRCVDDCGLENPHGLSVDSEGRLWVGCETGKIKVIQYLKIKLKSSRV
uniref:Tripartite motif-containing protein 2-like n=1 Tax=Crassostrea virginica TaxID=6565 RepID=A0A8B8BSK6_CRAVI|nr:tripartite motif-containing protein 2-like [Crassostrea virginica]